jgi:hypothetical protein
MHADLRSDLDAPSPGRTATGAIDYDHYRAIAQAERSRVVRELLATTAAWFAGSAMRRGGRPGGLARGAAAAGAR